jgi:quercetin dioxygenase-like cupin family protein
MTKSLALLAALATGAMAAPTPTAPQTQVKPLLTRDLLGLDGKEGMLLDVRYPPGGSDPVHRHNASVFVYVLEGHIVMQVRGGKEVALAPGQTFFEGPSDVHLVGRNASKTRPAHFLAFLVKDKNAPALVPMK